METREPVTPAAQTPVLYRRCDDCGERLPNGWKLCQHCGSQRLVEFHTELTAEELKVFREARPNGR